MMRSSFEKFGLSIRASVNGKPVGACSHMEVIGWPKEQPLRTKIAQKLSKLRLGHPHSKEYPDPLSP